MVRELPTGRARRLGGSLTPEPELGAGQLDPGELLPPDGGPPDGGPPDEPPELHARRGAKVSKKLHLIRRITFGPTPDLVAHVDALGYNGFVDEQLNPAALPDDGVDELLAAFPRLSQSAMALVQADEKAKTRRDLVAGSVLRAVASTRQLQEVMVDFWTNHFNVDAKQGLGFALKVIEDREVMRPLALGRFADLLEASAKSPAMLDYLDNRKSRADNGRIPNENYARELMELHTVGVDGGYDERDVLLVAHIFSGWSVETQEQLYRFQFRSQWNDLGPFGSQDVLGWVPVAPSGSIENGESLLAHLARLEQTATHVAWKLCRYFVSEDLTKSSAIVGKVADAYLANDTEVAPTLRVLFRSREFKNASNRKVKRPFHLLVGALRTMQASFDLSAPDVFGRTLERMLEGFGQLIHHAAPPTGFPDATAAWVSTGSMLNRWNLAFDLAANRISDISVDIDALAGTGGRTVDFVKDLYRRLLGHAPSKEERVSMLHFLGKRGRDPVDDDVLDALPALVGFVIASAPGQLR